MKRLTSLMLVRSALCAAFLAGGCAVFAGCGDDGQTAGTEHDCADGLDDDGDGLTDCHDPDCAESADCLPCNHDGVCDADEDSVRCPDDCPAPFCGDGSCNGNETLSTCPEDCAVCGDGYCDTPETRITCPEDCAVCNDGFCDTGETRVDCPEDCAVCDDGICDPGETRVDCPEDCAVCGDGFCDTGETRVDCLEDCVACGDGFCDTPETRVDCPEDCAVCNDGFCDTGEDKTNCPQDCIICGDGACDAPETLGNCPMDCANILLRETFTTWVPAGWSAANFHQATQSGTTYAQSTGPDFAQDAILESVTFSTIGYTNVGLGFVQVYQFGGTGVGTGVYVDATPNYHYIDQPTDNPPGLVEYDISTEAANHASVKIDFAIWCANTSQCFGSDYWMITNVVVYAW